LEKAEKTVLRKKHRSWSADVSCKNHEDKDSLGVRVAMSSFPLRPNFSEEYNTRSLNVLETALTQVGVYCAWQAFDLGREYPVDARYAAMPALTKKDILNIFPEVFCHVTAISMKVWLAAR